MKQIKLNTRNVAILSFFLLLLLGSCSSSNDSMGTDSPENPKPSDVKLMDKSKIVDYGKYYCPAKWNKGSVLDNYKMQIYLLYQTDWLAIGSGYDDKIGALWVNPSTCKLVSQCLG